MKKSVVITLLIVLLVAAAVLFFAVYKNSTTEDKVNDMYNSAKDEAGDMYNDAKDKVMMGSERKSMVMKEEERKLTAYHEGGHAIVALNQQASDPIHKATIIPRGRALGLVMRLPTEDRFSETYEQMLANMAIAMGGRAAEEMIFGHNKVTSGASSDIQQCTRLARNMVVKWGLSEKIGKVDYSQEDNGYMSSGKNVSADISPETAKLIDEEVKKLVDNAYDTASKILYDHKDELEIIAQALLEYETLTGDEIKEQTPHRLHLRQRPAEEHAQPRD